MKYFSVIEGRLNVLYHYPNLTKTVMLKRGKDTAVNVIYFWLQMSGVLL